LPSLVAVGLLAVAALLAYGDSLSNPFIFDDLGAIVDNPDIRGLWPLWQAPDESARPSLNARPVVRLSLALNYALSGLDVCAYRAVNLAAHFLCGLALFGLVQRLLRRPPLAARLGAQAHWLALAIALLWLVHPLNNQCINYLVQRSESLMGLFYLLTLYCALRSLEGRPCAWSMLAVLCCVLGVMSKEVMVTAPLLVLLSDRTFGAGTFAKALRWRWGLHAGLAGTWLVLAALMWTSPHGASVGFSSGITAREYLLNQGPVVADYLRKAFWPHPLILDYGFPRHLGLAQVWPEILLLVLLLGLTAVALWRWPSWGFGGAWFFLILAPTSSLVPIANEVGAERRAYLPLAGLIALVVLAAYQVLGRRPGAGRWLAAAVVLAALALGYRTGERNRDFATSLALWRTVVEAVPGNARGHTYLGLALVEQGQVEAAIAHYERALALKPEYAEAHNNLGIALATQGRLEQAIAHYRLALKTQPGLAQAHNNLGNALLTAGQVEEAMGHYERALALKPEYAEAHNNLGIALATQGRLQQAIARFRQALALRPEYAEARRNLDLALRQASGKP
jgi:tetratricopeptide (TPR) repeat protein